VFHHEDSACFVIDPHRSRAVVENFLGEQRPHFWVSDRFAAQMNWATKNHQVCLAHLIRDANYAIEYPHQPYNGNPHMHPGEQVLLRVIGQGRWQHPFHEHGNHVRILGRDGNLIVSEADSTKLAGPLLFTTTTTPGMAFDGIFYWTGRGLNWDAYGHNPTSSDPEATLPCTPDANGYNTSAPTAINYFEWCQ